MAEMAAAAWAFIKAAFVAVGSGTATAGQVATVVAVNVAGSVALSAATSVLMKPDVGGRAPGEWLADPNAGIPFAIGDRIGVAGNIVYKNTFGKDNEYKGIVTVLSGAGPISAYLGFTADREPIAFAGEAATGRYGGEMWMQRRLGEQPDTALTSPAAITYQTLPNWGPNHRLSGKAAFMWTLRMDSKFSVYPQGEPAPITVLRGIKGYDHRYDSTMPGGSGPCRLNDRSTYRTITNPAIADLNWCLGLRENGKVVGGLGVSPAGIDWSAYTRAANVADANAWTLAAYPRSDESKSEVRAGMLQAAGAVISRRAGLVSCVTRGAPKSPVMTISAADTAGPIELDTAANVLNRYNTMTPRYLSEAHEWQLAPAAPVSSNVYVEEDRGRVRSDQRDYPYVPNAKQAAELCALDIAHSREGIAGRWPLKAYCRELEPGDVFTVNEPGLLLDGMDVLVLDRDYDPETDTPYVVFVSETPGKVAWALGQQANPSPTPALSARHDLNAPDPAAFDVVIVPPSPEGVSTPGAEVVIDIDNVRAEDLVVEIGPSAEGPWRVVKTVTIIDSQLRIPVNELAAGEVFWVALSYRSADDGPSPKTIKGPYTAGDLVAGDTTHLNGEPVQNILDKLRDTAALADQNRRAVGELGEVYGDTVSAAASAAAAAASEAATIQARAEAVLAAAASDQRASAADAAKLEAQAARAGAVSARNESVDAATDSNAAAAVSKQERQLATQARSGAEAASSASVDARNQSASFADAAGVSAAASADSSVTATTAKEAAVAAAVAAMPDVIAANLLTVSPGGAPATSPDLPSAQVSGGVFTSLVGANTVALFKAVAPWKPGEIYEITIDVEGLAGSTAPTATPYAVRLKSDYGVDSAASPYEFMSFASTAVGQTTRRVIRFGLDVSPPASSGAATIGITASADAAFVRFGALFNYGAGAERQSRLKFLSIRNVTAQLAAESSATASAASASSAAASETASGQKAAAANEAMLLAQAARGGAQAAETGAVAARDGAEGYAATASAASNLSSQYRDQSQAAAQASNIAAGIASTKADEAGANAQAANAQKLAAEAARDAADQKAQASVLAAAQAEAFAGDAGAWARASEGSAVRAEAQAAQGLTYLNQTVDARDGAVAASISSGTSAGQAASDRQLAEEARDDARTAAATSIEQTASASASAAAAKISADLVTQVRRGERANLIDNPSGAADFRSWIKEGSPASYVDDDRLAGRIFVVYGYMVSQVYPAEPGDQHSLGFVASPLGDGGHLKIQYMIPGGPVDALVVPVGPDGYDLRRRSSAPSMAPAGTTGFRVVVVAPTGGVLPVWAIKVNFGSVAADFSDDYSATVIQGQLNITAAVAAEAADRVGAARFSVTGGAGGDPFDISLLAGPDGSAASLTATRVRLRNIVNGQAINVLEVVGGKARFGGDVEIDGNLLLSGTLNGRRVIIPDTVTPMAATYAAGSVALNGTAPTQVQEVWVTTQGGPVVVEFNGLVNMRHDPAGSFDAIMEVRRSPNAGSGIQMLYMSVPALGGGNDSVLGMYPLKLIDRPAAGTWRYFVTVWSTANNMSIQEVRQRFMSALEYRTNS